MSRKPSIRKSPGLALAAIAALSSGVAGGLVRPSPAFAEEDTVRVSAAELEGSGDAVTVRLRASREPTFTVFRLDAPSRVVVDLARADVSALAAKGRLEGRGVVVSLAATQFDDPRARVGRVVITVKDGTRYDVRVQGSDLVVELRAPGAVASAPIAAPAADDNVVSTAAPAADDKVVSVEIDALPAGTVGGSRLLAASLRESGGVATLSLVTDGPIARYQIVELKEPGRLALDLEAFTGSPRLARNAAGPVKALRIARHEGHVRVVLEAATERFPEYEITRNGKGLQVSVGVRRKAPEPVAATPRAIPVVDQAVAEKPVAEKPVSEKAGAVARVAPAEIRTLDVSGRGRESRVVFALTKAVETQVERTADGSFALTLKGARLPKELARRLDASALDGPVASVASYSFEIAPGEEAVRVVVGLRAGEQDVQARISTLEVGPSAGLLWTFTGAATRPALLAAAAPRAPGGFMGEAPAYAMNAAPRAAAYSGKRVDFTAKDLDIIQFLQAIGEVSKRNIVASDDVTGKVSVRLRNVPWDEALDIVLRTKGLGKEEIGTIIRIAPLERLRSEQKSEVEAKVNEEAIQPLKVRLIPVNYAEAQQISDRVKDILSTRGTVSVDMRTNVLIVKDVVDSLAKAELLVRSLDTQTPQVLIEARIVEASTSFSRSVGIQWGGDVKATPATGNPTGLVFPNLISMVGAATDGQTPTTGTSSTPNFAVNMPAPIGANTGGGLGFIFGSAGGAANLNLRLSAAEVNGTIKLVSAPKVSTLDNQAASISQGISIPFSQTSAAGVNTTFIEARLSLDVTPHVTADGSILLTIKASNNQPNPQLTGANGQPSIAKREANTRVLVKDGDTTVIGGIYTRRNSLNTNEVPFFSKIPVIGRLFSRDTVTDDRTEMLIFITPRIVNRQQSIVSGGEQAN